MKKIISLVLVAALLAFLCMTNPTTEEFAAWYAEQAQEAISPDASILQQVLTTFTAQLAEGADRDNYMICSVFHYGGHKTLGIGLMFFPLDSLTEQFRDLRSAYADWLDGCTR